MMNFHLNAVTNLVLRLGPVAQRWELSLARAVFLHRLGEIRDRKPENQSYRASGLTLLTATISLWNTVYMERAVDALKRKGVKINEQLLSHLSPLGWEHINLTGDYIWKNNRIPASGKFRRLRPAKVERSKNDLNEWKGLPLDMCLISSCAIMG
ncbi:Tn3 transposase DDE domain protein [Morganella morganii]